MDVEACAANVAPGGKFAFVLTHVGYANENFLPYIGAMRAKALANNIDILMVMTKSDAKEFLRDSHRKKLKDNGVKLVEVDWAVPPNMKFTRPERWCGGIDLIRLQALGLEGYDAVSYYDADVEMHGDVMAPLKCASTGVLISTNGGVGEPFNVGFFAVRPDPKYMKAALSFAKLASFDDKVGWAESGFAPSGGYYVGAECGQGFFHTLFYKAVSNSSKVGRQALQEAGLLSPGYNLLATQIDKCVWNYQTSYQCKSGFDCSRVAAHHKPGLPGQRGSDPNECMKWPKNKTAAV
jgi:hypothetical protein